MTISEILLEIKISSTNRINYYIKAIKPATTRDKVVIFVILASFALLIIIPKELPQWLETLLITAFSSSLATALIEFFNSVAEKLDLSIKQNKFSSLFGYFENYIYPSQNVSLILPQFNVDVSEEEKDEDSSSLIALTAVDLSQGKLKASIEADIIASSYIISSFSSLALDTPRVLGDTETFSALKNLEVAPDSKDNENLISIGIFTNKIINLVFAEDLDLIDYKEKYSLYFSTERKNFPQDQKNPNFVQMTLGCGFFKTTNKIYADPENWNYYYVIWDSKKRTIISNKKDYLEEKNRTNEETNKKVKDYGLLARFIYKGKRIVVFGAVTAYGTKALAEYISKEKNWNKVNSHLSKRKSKNIEEKDAFCVVFTLPINDNYIDINQITKTVYF